MAVDNCDQRNMLNKQSCVAYTQWRAEETTETTQSMGRQGLNDGFQPPSWEIRPAFMGRSGLRFRVEG